MKNKAHAKYDEGYGYFQRGHIEESRRCSGAMDAYYDCINELERLICLLTSRSTGANAPSGEGLSETKVGH